MLQILFGSLVLSVIHALIPNHWLPIVAVAKTQHWSRSETLGITALTGSAHTLSTVIIGIAVGLVGYRLGAVQELATKTVAPIILIAVGALFILMDYRKSHSHDLVSNPSASGKRSKWAIVSSLSIAMFFSPCLEIDAYFFTAGMCGGREIAVVSIVYFFVTVLGMLAVVDLARRGVERIKWHFLDTHEKLVTGVILVILGISISIASV